MRLRAASLPSTSAAFLIASTSACAAVRIFVGLFFGDLLRAVRAARATEARAQDDAGDEAERNGNENEDSEFHRSVWRSVDRPLR